MKKDKPVKSIEEILEFIDKEISYIKLIPGDTFHAGLLQGLLSSLDEVKDFILGEEES